VRPQLNAKFALPTFHRSRPARPESHTEAGVSMCTSTGRRMTMRRITAHRITVHRILVRRILASLLLPPVVAAAVVAFAAGPASASRRGDAFAWATGQIGCPYVFGGTGPCHNGFDCSGLVWAAYAHQGVSLPRTTQEMLSSGRLKRVTGHPHRGELVFFGSGHVTLYYTRHVVLQAPEPGENVQFTRWYPGSSWVPTGIYKVRDAG
jgi:cell wall-associated NlpC family hydrolase